LAAIPREYATDATKMRLTAHMPEIKAQQILERSLIRRFIEVSDGGRVLGLNEPATISPGPQRRPTSYAESE